MKGNGHMHGVLVLVVSFACLHCAVGSCTQKECGETSEFISSDHNHALLQKGSWLSRENDEHLGASVLQHGNTTQPFNATNGVDLHRKGSKKHVAPGPTYTALDVDLFPNVLQFMDSQTAKMGLRDIGALPSTADSRGRPKVAFIFLTYSSLENEDVWDTFFEGENMNKYSIYVHRVDNKSLPTPLEKWGAFEAPRVPSAHCALSGLEVVLMAHALKDKANTQFVLLAGDSVPLKPFSYIYSQLADETPSTSKLCYKDYGLDMPDWNKNFPRVMKHHQWVVLSREHALRFVRNFDGALGEVYEAITLSGHGCSDEASVNVALLRDQPVVEKALAQSGEISRETLSELNIQEACLTWNYWRYSFADTRLDPESWLHPPKGWSGQDHPVHFDADYPVNADYLKQLVTSEGFMFARKFRSGCTVEDGKTQVELRDRLGDLWKDIDTRKSSSQVWTRLDRKGVPK